MKSVPALAVAALAAALAAPSLGAEAPKAAAQKQKEAARPPAPESPAPQVDVKKTLYGIGLVVARGLEVFALSGSELDEVMRGVRDGWADRPKAQLDQKMQAAINDLVRQRAPKAQAKAAAKEKAVGAPYLAKILKEKGARKTASGAIVVPIVEGKGASPKETDRVKVNYTGTLVNGQVFDSTVGRGPAEFPLKGVVRCWGEALQTMKVGGKAKIVCPPETAYGERGSPPAVPGNAVLTFEVELLDIPK